MVKGRNMITFLLLDCTVDGTATVNGSFCGRIGENKRLSIPISDTQEAFIKIDTLDADYKPINCSVNIENSRPVSPIKNCKVFRWAGGINQVIIKPIKEIIYPPLIPSVLADLNFTHHGGNALAQVISFGDTWLVIEDDRENTLLIKRLSVSGGNCNLEYSDDHLIFSENENLHVCKFDDDGWKFLGSFTGQEYVIENESLKVSKKLNDSFEHEMIITAIGDEINREYKSSINPSTDNEICKGFLESIVIGNYDEARNLMSETLKEQIDEQALKDYIGNPEFSLPPIHNDGRLIWAVALPTAPNIYDVNEYIFKIVDLKIDDISIKE